MKNRWTRKTPRQSRAQFTYNAILEATRQVLSGGGGYTTHHIAERAGVRAQWAKLRDAANAPIAGSPWVVPAADNGPEKVG